MSFIFVGGEDHDFLKIGVCSVDTGTPAARRTAYARCSLLVGNLAGSGDGWIGNFSSASSGFWLSTRCYITGISGADTSYDFLSFMDGGVRRLRLRPQTGGATGSQTFVLSKADAAGSSTTLATASVALARAAIIKIDIHVTYAASGQVDVYFDGVLALTYTGDVTTDSATTLSGFVLGVVGSISNFSLWSEVIAGSLDTRSMSLVTLAPAANGNAFSFDAGSYADLDEVTLNDADIATSGTANQLAQVTVDSSGITGNPAIRAVCVSARAQKGGTGPANAELGVRTASVDYFSGDIALPASLRRISNVWELNPATSGAWAHTDLTSAGFNIGVKSIT